MLRTFAQEWFLKLNRASIIIGSSNVIDWSTGDIFHKSISTNETFTFSNISEGQSICVIILNTSASAKTITLPAGIIKSDDLDLSVDSNKYNAYTFIRSNEKTFVSYVSKMS